MAREPIEFIQAQVRQGAYFWRPPLVSHGPIATLPGFMALFRSHGGSRTTQRSAEEHPLVRDAPHRPALPPRLQRVAFQPFNASACSNPETNRWQLPNPPMK